MPAINHQNAGMARSYKDGVYHIKARRNVVCQQK
jgi:hypothetical protein